MSTQYEFAARFSMDESDFRRAAKNVKGDVVELKGELKKVGKAGSSADKGFRKGAAGAKKLAREERRLAKESESTAQSLTKIKNVVTGIAFGLAAQDFTSTIFEYEKFKGQLESTFKGSTELAGEAFKAIESFAKETPFTLDQSVNAFVKLRNMGIAPTQALMKSMANTSAATGKDLNQFVEAIADAATGEFERLKEFGVKARSEGDKVAFTFQGVTTTVGKNSDEIVQYLQNIGESNFAGAAAAQMEKLPGVVSNLRDNVQTLWRTIGDSGATDIMVGAIKSVSSVVGDLTDMIATGYLGEALTIQFSEWIDGAEMVKSGLGTLADWLEQKVFSPISLMMLGEGSFDPTKSGYVQFATVVKNAFFELPTNLKAMVAVMIGEADILRMSIIERFALMSLGIEETWSNAEQFGDASMGAMKLVVAQVVDGIIEDFARMVGGMGGALESMPDKLVPDSWITSIREAEAAIKAQADGEAKVRAEIKQTQKVYQEEIKDISNRRDAVKQLYDQKRSAARSAIDSALAERSATLANKKAQLENAKANHESAKASKVSAEEHDRLAKAEMAAAQAAEEQGEASDKASKKTIKATERKLASVIKATETERDKVERWYSDSVSALEEAERLKLSATKDYASLRADVEAEYAERISKIQTKELDKQLDDWESYGGEIMSLYDQWSDSIEGVLDGNTKSFSKHMDSMFDRWKKTLIGMVAQWAKSGLAGLLNGEGFKGFDFGKLFGGKGGGIGDIIGKIIGGGKGAEGGLGGIIKNLLGGKTGGFTEVVKSAKGLFSSGGSIAKMFGSGGTIAKTAMGAWKAVKGGALALKGGAMNLIGAIPGWGQAALAAVAVAGIVRKLVGGGARSFDEIMKQDIKKSIFGGGQEGFSAVGAGGATGFDGGNTGVFGGNYGIQGTGMVAQHLAAGGENGGVAYLTGSQAALEKFSEALKQSGVEARIAGGVLEANFGDMTKQQFLDLWQAHADGLDQFVPSTEVAATAFENNLIRPTNLFLENLTVVTGKSAFEVRDMVTEMDSLYEQYRESGVSKTDAVFQAFAEASGLTLEQAKKFFAESGQSADEWAEKFQNNTKDQINALLDFDAAGKTAFESISGAATSSAEIIKGDFNGATLSALKDIDVLKGQGLKSLHGLADGAESSAKALTGYLGDAAVDTAKTFENEWTGLYSRIDLGKLKNPDPVEIDIYKKEHPPGAKSEGPTKGRDVPSYDVGSTRILNDGIAMLHKNEMVLDAETANRFRSSMNGAQATSSNNQQIAELLYKLDVLISQNTVASHQGSVTRG